MQIKGNGIPQARILGPIVAVLRQQDIIRLGRYSLVPPMCAG